MTSNNTQIDNIQIDNIQIDNTNILIDFVKKNVALYDINNIEIHFGKKINDIIFDTRSNYKSEKIDHFDLIPMINSLLSPFIETKEKINFKKYQTINYENTIFTIKQCLSSKKIDYEYYQNNLEDYNITDTFCLKSKNKSYKNPIYFTNMKNYNHKENCLLIEWICFNDVRINLKVYKTYLSLSALIDVVEQNKIPQKKMDMIDNIFEKLELIYTNYLNN